MHIMKDLLDAINKKRQLVFLTLLIFVLIIMVYCIRASNINSIYTPTEWRGLVPGKTIKQNILEILGEPEKNSIVVVESHMLELMIYENRPNDFNGWRVVRLFLENRDSETVLIGVSLKWATQDTMGTPQTDIRFLYQLILTYGKPEKVKWFNGVGSARVMIWASRGVAVVADAAVSQRAWDELFVYEILIFEPMTTEQFLATGWARLTIQWADRRYGATNIMMDAPYEEDPYDWSNMPQP